LANVLRAIVLGIVQGATEFVPVSSSGHLVLVPWLLHWENMGLAFGALLHLGTLVAVVAFFWRDLWRLVMAGLVSVKERSLAGDPFRKLAWLIVLGSVPAALLGFAFEGFFETLFGQPFWVGILLVGTGVLLAASERWGHRRLEMTELGWMDALVVGLGQAIAIAPGISRSGATISAGLWRGLHREAAARFSFLLSVPVILGAGLFELKDVFQAPLASSSPATLLVGFAAAVVSGFLSIRYLLRYLQTRTLYPFAIYCWVAGLASVFVSILGIR
jgi:undecaprenyl-diphosphatase